MKKLIFLLFLCCSFLNYSQQLSSKKFTTTAESIELDTKGLDEVLITTSTDNFIEIKLLDNNLFESNIVVDDTIKNILKINFTPIFKIEKKAVFKKFITKRVNYVTAEISIPKNKTVTIFGSELDIKSKSYNGDFAIYIDKGNINFNKVNGNVAVNLFSGNIAGTQIEGAINIDTHKGRIKIDTVLQSNPYQKEAEKSTRKFTVNSVNANVVLSSLKTQ